MSVLRLSVELFLLQEPLLDWPLVVHLMV